MWYPRSSAGYAWWEAPRDPEARQEREIRRAERDWAEIELTGWCVLTLRRCHRKALIGHYRGGQVVGNRARAAALSAFAIAWGSWRDVQQAQNSL